MSFIWGEGSHVENDFVVSGCMWRLFFPPYFSLHCSIIPFFFRVHDLYVQVDSEVFWVQHELFRFQSELTGSWLAVDCRVSWFGPLLRTMTEEEERWFIFLHHLHI